MLRGFAFWIQMSLFSLSPGRALASPRILHPLACTGSVQNGTVRQNVVITYGYSGGVTWVQFPEFSRTAGLDEFHVLITVYDATEGGYPGREVRSHRSFGRVAIEDLGKPGRLLKGRLESWPVVHDRPRDPARDPRRLAKTLMEVELNPDAFDSRGVVDLGDLGLGHTPVKCEIDWRLSSQPIHF